MKRFTDTNKWSDPWFMCLEPRLKLLWLWICDNCDNSGVIDMNWKLAGFQIGADVSSADLDSLASRVDALDCGKLFVRKFVGFQFGKLSNESRVHQHVMREADKNGVSDRVCIPYTKGIDTLKDKDKDKDKEKEKEKVVVEPADDTQWLATLSQNPAYAGIDVAREHAKMVAWCAVNRKQPTRRRFVNWLNRAEKPMSAITTLPANQNASQTPSSANAGLSNMDRYRLEKELEKVEEKIQSMRDDHNQGGGIPWTDQERAQIKALKARRDEIKAKLPPL